jgi:hypothetical protein
MERQILLIKGWQGFADRLQVISHAIHYCLQHNANICVDWRDDMWGQGREDFTDYFEILGVLSVPLTTVIEKVKNGALVNPPAYTLEHISDPPSPRIHLPEFVSGIGNDYLKQEGDIIVHNSKGVRMWHLNNLVMNFRISKKIAPIIIEKLSSLQMPYSAIHLRGTDRSAEIKLTKLMQEYDELASCDKVRSYVLSDMNSYIDEWTQKYPNSIILDKNAPVLKLPTSSKGTHTLSSKVLEVYGISKHELNINTIVDFLVIAFSANNIGNKESVFTSLAVVLREANEIALHLWLDWAPPRVLLLKS